MDETTLKTVENAVVICAESAKNATESATKALEAKQDVDTRIAELGETIQDANEDIKRAEDAAQSASKSAESASQSAILINNAKDEIVRIGAQITTDKALIKGYASSASSSASRAEEAKRIAVNAVEVIGETQDEIGATKTKIDATAKTVQSNADAVANAKTEIDGKIATANTAINEAVEKAEQASASAENAMRYTYAEPIAVDGVVSLVDRAVNKVAVEGSVVFAMPSAVEGRVRDLMIDLTLSAEVSVAFDGVVLPRDGDDSNLAPEVGRNIFLLTEIEPNTFLCSRCTVSEVAV